jgi:hypothetical protein
MVGDGTSRTSTDQLRLSFSERDSLVNRIGSPNRKPGYVLLIYSEKKAIWLTHQSLFRSNPQAEAFFWCAKSSTAAPTFLSGLLKASGGTMTVTGTW